MRHYFLPAVISLTISCFAHLCFPQGNAALAETPDYVGYISLSGGHMIIDSSRDRSGVDSRGKDDYNEFDDRDISYDDGFFIDMAFGLHGPYIRGDISFAYLDSAIDLRGDTNNIRADYDAFENLFNIYFHFLDRNSFRFQPYIGAGIGYSVWRFSDQQGLASTDIQTAFNAHLTGGLNYQLTQKLAVGLFYRFTYVANYVGEREDPTNDSDEHAELKIGPIFMHKIGASIIYAF